MQMFVTVFWGILLAEIGGSYSFVDKNLVKEF